MEQQGDYGSTAGERTKPTVEMDREDCTGAENGCDFVDSVHHWCTEFCIWRFLLMAGAVWCAAEETVGGELCVCESYQLQKGWGRLWGPGLCTALSGVLSICMKSRTERVQLQDCQVMLNPTPYQGLRHEYQISVSGALAPGERFSCSSA